MVETEKYGQGAADVTYEIDSGYVTLVSHQNFSDDGYGVFTYAL